MADPIPDMVPSAEEQAFDCVSAIVTQFGLGLSAEKGLHRLLKSEFAQIHRDGVLAERACLLAALREFANRQQRLPQRAINTAADWLEKRQ